MTDSVDAGGEVRFKEPGLTINKVYTRGGDRGMTRLVGGQRVSKGDLRLECYGTVDELNAVVGQARLSCQAIGLDGLAGDLLRVQHALFNLGNMLAAMPEDLVEGMPRVGPAEVKWLEARMDEANESLPTLRSFVLPGGNRANADLHLARTVCRRAERLCVALADREADLPGEIVPYINRLSDAFFVWSRAAVHRVGAEEVLWAPNEA